MNPTRYILFADSVRTDTMRQIFRLFSNNTHASGSIHLRHNDRANVFFFDGHVAAVDASEFGQYEPEVRGGYDLAGNAAAFPRPE